MNQNDMDRYYWRTGRRWSGDSRSLEEIRRKVAIPRRAAWWMFIAVLVTFMILLWMRSGA